MTNLSRELIVRPGRKFNLEDRDPSQTFGVKDKESTQATLAQNQKRLSELQNKLYADRRFALLIVLQALDAGGKDGTISHVMSGVNPQGCEVTSFKVPSSEEAEHDFLWRIHKAVPRRGVIGIFNRSHYEDVLVTRVHKLVPKEVWKPRFEQINEFERTLDANNVRILKFFLHISKEEQRRRFEERVSDPAKYWKISPADFAERKHWDDYQEAYTDTLRRCSTAWAPWYVIPSDHKWFRNYAISSIVVEALEAMKLHFPKSPIDLSEIPAEFRGGPEGTGTEHSGSRQK